MQNLHYVATMDIMLFRDLDRLSRTGNFSQAAEIGHLSQSAFSRRIRTLEAWVGVQLVDRTRQPVKLTAAGTAMLEAGLQALTRIEHERSQILEARSLPDKYVVTFGAQHSIGWRFYPAWLQAFEEAYGPILSRLRADDLPICLRDLRNGDVDFVIAYADRETDGGEKGGGSARAAAMESITIGEDRLIPVCKPAGDGQPMYDFVDDRIAMPFLQFGDGAPISEHLTQLFRIKSIGRQLRTVYENSMAGALRIRARDGAGVAWLPESLVAPDLTSGFLVQTGPADWTVDLEIRLYRDLSHSNRLTRAIWAFLDERQSNFLLAQDRVYGGRQGARPTEPTE